jgi:type III secretion protein R
VSGAAVPVAGSGDGPVELLLVLGALALAPLVVMTLTSFLKVVVVLSVLRSALGAPQVPPSAAVTGLALLVTMLVMQPVATESWQRWRAGPPPVGVEGTLRAGERALEPLRAFLLRFSHPSDRRAFAEVAARARPGEPSALDESAFRVLAPAFVTSELRRAFTIGFLVFLPFLVVDLTVANVLLALGLTQLSPTAVALPFKLLLLVAVDGLGLLARGLAVGYLP